MSLSKIPRCATCLRDQVVELKKCSICEIIKYCSEFCEKKNRSKHARHCEEIRRNYDNRERFEAILEIALIHNDSEALEMAVDGLQMWHSSCCGGDSGAYVIDAPDMVCFYIELGND